MSTNLLDCSAQVQTCKSLYTSITDGAGVTTIVMPLAPFSALLPHNNLRIEFDRRLVKTSKLTPVGLPQSEILDCSSLEMCRKDGVQIATLVGAGSKHF